MKQNCDTPDDLSRALLSWYAREKRDLPWRRTKDPYAIWISEVMLQQTQVKTVVPYFQRFMALFPTIDRLAGSDLGRVLKAWEGLGYYSRARHLHRAAQIVSENMGGRLPDQWNNLRQLPGVGDYIASAVLSIAFQQPVAVVDGNVKRVLARLLTMKAPINQSSSHKYYQQQANRLLDRHRPGDFNQALMELGALVCLPRKPKCERCPLTAHCRAFASGRIEEFPTRVRSASVPEKILVAAAIHKNGRLLLVRRPPRGLLGGLWELPNGEVSPGLEPVKVCAGYIRKTVGLDIAVNRRLTTIRHAYTHFKISMDVYDCLWLNGNVRLNGPDAYRWIIPSRIARYALHKAMAKAWPYLSGRKEK